ncbi:MAG TPA: type II toxin-antitoxin system RnlA family toxin [Firmicutes bacterium]|nr:type II toxin-antitoxin system RnlA family toxin [Bacillota bacterium]
MNENKTERRRIENAEPDEVRAMLSAMESGGYTRKKFTPTSFVSHLEIYQYLSPSGVKFAIVYDTKAKIISVDGRSDAMPALFALFPPRCKPAGERPAQPDRQPKQPERQKLQQPAERPALRAETRKGLTSAEKPALARPAAKPAAEKADGGKQPAAAKAAKPDNKQTVRSEKKPAKKKAVKKEQEPKPVVVRGVSAKRLDWLIKDLKAAEGVKARTTTAAFDKTRAITLTSPSRETLELVRDERGNVTLTGKPGALMSDVKAQLESKSDVRLLRRYLPTALRYLSESSKIDLSNGITDINNIGRLSDYSVLLTAPYRALEKFIYDLQQAERINVKMIGQAYEKDDEGNYKLKKGYLKKINSVVYSEVMTALYTEYSRTRNFYTHSDNSADSRPRGISDKAEAQKLLTHLLSVIEYNAKKLSEIGFSVTEE